jgi:hypothetical protein
VHWDPDGTPVLGYPVADSVALAPPSGELGSTGTPNPYQRGWGDAFDDAAEGNTTRGRRSGAWTQLFRGANSNYETYTVAAGGAVGGHRYHLEVPEVRHLRLL